MFDAGGGAPAEGGGGGRGEGDLISAIFLPPGASKGGKLFFASSLLLFVRENEGSSQEGRALWHWRAEEGGARQKPLFPGRLITVCLCAQPPPRPLFANNIK